MTSLMQHPDSIPAGADAGAGVAGERGRPSAVELRRLVLALVRAGRTPEALSDEFEPTVQEIWNWVIRVARDAGHSADGLARAEREELRRLRREVRQLREARDRPAMAETRYADGVEMIPSPAAG